MVMCESLATSTDVSGCEWYKTGIYTEEGPLVKMRLRRPSEPPGNGDGLVRWLSPAGVLTFIHKPDCYFQRHQNSKQWMEVSEQRPLGNSKAWHRNVCGHLSFLLENLHCFTAEAPKPETLEQAPVHPQLPLRLSVSRSFRRSIFPT